jgi:bla regulator protein BlaR1
MIGELTNHLWQSTLFAVAAGLLAIACRKNRAQIRYCLWLSASLKFLVPFSLLMSLGSHLELVPTAKKIATQAVSFTVVRITQPFTDPVSFVPSTPGSTHWLPIAILGLWVCGFGVIALVRFKSWLGIRAAVRASTPLPIPATVEVRSSAGLLEPGVVGLLRQVLLLPAGIIERLTKPQLQAVLTHELCHVRRRDNFTAALHMIVEAVFWFHPLVWWIGARLVEERERACDEDVLRLGSEPHVYAEGILKVCEFYVESPLICVVGVTRNNLKKRVERIMGNHVGETLNIWRKLFLATVGVMALALPMVLGLLNTTQSFAKSQDQNTAAMTPVFQAASIKPSESVDGGIGWFSPDQYTATGATLQTLIRDAYGVQDNQISGAPYWLNSEKYAIEAKMDKSVADELAKLGPDQRETERNRMLQALFANGFKLSIHRETRELPVYALVIAKNGPKLQDARPGDTYPNGIKDLYGEGHGDVMSIRRGQLTGQGIPIADLVQMLSQQLGRFVLDKTGLTGKYDFTLQWMPDTNQAPTGSQQRTDNSPPPDFGFSLFTAIQEQLGLKLEPQKGPVEVLVIDHAEKPAEEAKSSDLQAAESDPSISTRAITRAVGVNSSGGSDRAGASKTEKSQDFSTHTVYWSVGIFYTPNPRWGGKTVVLNKVFSSVGSRYDLPKLKDEFKSWVLAQHSDWVDGYSRLSVVASAFANRQGADSARERLSMRSLDDELIEVEWTPSKP